MARLYDVYDGKRLVLTRAKYSVVRQFLTGSDKVNIDLYKYATAKYRNRYTIVESKSPDIDIEFWYEWDRTIMLFNNVKWVAHNGRKLTLGGYDEQFLQAK